MEGVQHTVFTLILQQSRSEAVLDSVLGNEPGMINKIYSGEYVGPVNYRGRLGIRAVLPLTIPTGNTAQCHPHGSVNPEGEHWPPQSTQDSGSFPLPSTAAFQAAEPTQDGADWVPLADEEKQIASFWVSSYTHDLWFEKRP